jgi:hypothetical protein
MVLLMLAATLSGVVQMLVLAWPTRTVRLPTALLTVAVGVYACGALALVLELASAHTLVALSDIPLSDAVKQASYTIDPVLEELAKIVPLLLIGINVRSRLQHGLTDYVVLGAGLGAGFGLLEATARFGMKADQAIPISGGGWILPNLTPPYVPGVDQVLTTPFPAPVGFLDIANLTKLATGLSSGTSIHLAWSALAGLGVGLLLRGRAWARLLGLVPIAFACGLHTLHNYVAVKPEAAAESFANAFDGQLWLIPLTSLAIAMALDLKTLRWAKAVVPGALLAGEQTGLSALLRFSVTALPWTAWIVLRFVPVRRSLWYLAARSTPATAEPLRQVVSSLAAEMNAAGHRQAWRGLPVRRLLLTARGWKLRLALIVITIALTVPAALLLGIGSFPSHAVLQKTLATGTGAKAIYWLAIAGLVWILWRLIAGVIGMRRAAASPLGEVVTTARFQLLVALGALSIGGVLLYLRFTGTQLNKRLLSNYHLLDALNDLLLVVGLALMLLALFALFPPGGLVLATGGVVAGGITAETAATLGLSGILLMTAGARGRGTGGSTSGSSGEPGAEVSGVKQRPPAPKPQVADPKLRNLVDNLWKNHASPQRTGDGTTMDAVRNELMTGRLTKNTDHIKKARQTKRDLWRWTKDHPDASRHDHEVADDLTERLENALNTKRQG